MSDHGGGGISGASYSECYRVPFGDTDAAGVVFYPNYYRWFDRMTHALFRSIGHPLLSYMAGDEGPFLVETHCSFLLPVRYDDDVRLAARVTELRRSAFRVEHTVELDGAMAARGHEIRVWSNLREGRSAPLPSSVRGALLGTKPQH